jgi:hypothetical protein
MIIYLYIQRYVFTNKYLCIYVYTQDQETSFKHQHEQQQYEQELHEKFIKEQFLKEQACFHMNICKHM